MRVDGCESSLQLILVFGGIRVYDNSQNIMKFAVRERSLEVVRCSGSLSEVFLNGVFVD